MRQTTKRYPPERRAQAAPALRHPGPLDIGLAVSVYCAESGSRLLPEDAPEPPPEAATPHVTEH